MSEKPPSPDKLPKFLRHDGHNIERQIEYRKAQRIIFGSEVPKAAERLIPPPPPPKGTYPKRPPFWQVNGTQAAVNRRNFCFGVIAFGCVVGGLMVTFMPFPEKFYAALGMEPVYFDKETLIRKSLERRNNLDLYKGVLIDTGMPSARHLDFSTGQVLKFKNVPERWDVQESLSLAHSGNPRGPV